MWLIILCGAASAAAWILAFIAWQRDWPAHATVAAAGGTFGLLLTFAAVLAACSPPVRALLALIPDVAWQIVAGISWGVGAIVAYRVTQWLRGHR